RVFFGARADRRARATLSEWPPRRGARGLARPIARRFRAHGRRAARRRGVRRSLSAQRPLAASSGSSRLGDDPDTLTATLRRNPTYRVAAGWRLSLVSRRLPFIGACAVP